MRISLAVVALLGLLGGCTFFPSARNVTLAGTATYSDGRPVSNLQIYYVVLKFQPGMPGTGEHGVVTTDSEGRYRIRLREVFDAVDLSEGSFPYQCGGKIADIPVERLASNRELIYDFVCRKPVDRLSKPKPVHGQVNVTR